jgi:type IV secretory pathway TraG/TraD family ATPase VirD4
MTDPTQYLRRRREISKAVTRAITPKEIDAPFVLTLIKALGSMVIGAIIWGVYNNDSSRTVEGAMAGLVLFSSYPLLSWVLFSIQHQKLAPPRFFEKFDLWQVVFCVILLAWLAVYGFNNNYVRMADYFNHTPYETSSLITPTKYELSKMSRYQKRLLKNKERMQQEQLDSELPIQGKTAWGVIWLLTAILLGKIFQLIKRYRIKNSQQTEPQPLPHLEKKKAPFKLWVGISTGALAEVKHGASIGAWQNVSLSCEDAAQNIIVLGGIGSGKTSSAINPMLIQLMDQECGGLIFDIKGNFWETVISFSKKTERNVITLGPNHQKINLLSNLTPEIASSFLKSIFLLNSKGVSDSFWIDTATELCRNTLGVLSFFEEKYTLRGLYSYLFDEDYREDVDDDLKIILPTLDESQKGLMAAYDRYRSSIFEKFDEKVQANVNATVALVLSPFTHPTLMEAFCFVNPKNSSDELITQAKQAKLSSTLDGDIYLVSLPLSVWGLAGKVVYSFIKLSFYNVMQQRNLQKDWNQERPVFFMCDEFQEIVSANRDGLSDLNFWDKSRSSKTIGIISAQAVSSFYAAIGDRDVSHALLQNFRQKLCFRTEDTVTLNYFNSLADRTEVMRETKSRTVGGSSSSSETTTQTLVDKPVLSPQLFRNLDPNHAIAILSINGHSMDDVLQMKQIFSEDHE